nr:YggS family pyridoxal phosphate-dependent enzyme [Lapillicoccus sp.]
MARRDELARNLAAVEERISRACADAGRSRDEVRLIVVTKFFPPSDVAHLLALGVRDVGESRAQEATEKFADDELIARHRRAGCGEDMFVTTHFIGQVQTNKAAAVVGWADVVHAADRPKLVAALDRAAGTAGKSVGVLVQVAFDGDEREDDADGGRAGVRPDDAEGLADAVAECPHLDLAGVMAVAPRDADPDVAFGRLAEVARGIRERHPDATWVSAGMSGDLEAAIRHGATHLRVGTAILGSRPTLR